MNEHDEKLRQKLLAEYEKKIKNAKVVQEQLLDFKMKYLRKYQEEQLEGQLIKRQAEEELEKEKQKEHVKRLKLVDQKEGFKRANEEISRLAQEEKLKEIEFEKKIGEYAQKRDAMTQMRKDKEEQKFKEKQETRQRLIDRQMEQLMSIKDRQDEILNKQVEEAEIKAQNLFEEKERRRFEMKQAIEVSRQHQI